MAELKTVVAFFGYKGLSAFRADWDRLTEQDRVQIRTGLGDGSLTY